jgi:hypothetical protein
MRGTLDGSVGTVNEARGKRAFYFRPFPIHDVPTTQDLPWQKKN